MHPMLNIAVKAARAAGKIINRASMDLDLVKVGTKGPNDFVTEADQAAEAAIIEVLKQAYPDHAILAEESGSSGDSDYVWIIDPIDGTSNFIHGYPCYAVSIALQVRGQMTQALVYDPVNNDLYTATRGEGAYLNNKRIRVSKRLKLAESLMGVSYSTSQLDPEEQTRRLIALNATSAGIRRSGSAVMDLAYLACGRLDAYIARGLQPWDIAAGALLVQEAGGLVTDYQGESTHMETGNLIAANPKLLPHVLRVVQGH
jgi:myo-inositol-1(or 4)-monophosphatase